MSIKNYDELNPMQMDVLRELGNIGSGNAATALSAMLGRMVDMKVPTVRVLDYAEAIEFAGGPETIITGMLIRMDGDIEGMILFLLEKPFASLVINTLFDAGDNIDFLNLGETEKSLLNEIGNIMSGSYLSAISQLAGLFINMSVPSLTVDMLGAIMSVPAIEFAEVSDKVLFIDEQFIIDDKHIKSNMILIPEISSLSVLLQRLGVE